MANLVSPIGRVAYPNLAKARQRNENSKPRFSLTLVFGEDVDLSEIKKQVQAVVKEEYPDGLPKNFRNPFRSGEDREKEDGSYPAGFCASDTFCEFWKNEEQGTVPCVDEQRNDLLASDVYAGCLGRVSFRPFCYNVDGNKGVSFCLEAFQKAGDGEPIGAAPVNPQAAFTDLETADEDAASIF